MGLSAHLGQSPLSTTRFEISHCTPAWQCGSSQAAQAHRCACWAHAPIVQPNRGAWPRPTLLVLTGCLVACVLEWRHASRTRLCHTEWVQQWLRTGAAFQQHPPRPGH